MNMKFESEVPMLQDYMYPILTDTNGTTTLTPLETLLQN